MSRSADDVSRETREGVHVVIRDYMRRRHLARPDEFTPSLQSLKEEFEREIADLADPPRADFFDRAVARVVLEMVASGAKKTLLSGLVEAILYGPGMRQPSGLVDLAVFLDVAEAMIINARTYIVAWLVRDGQQVDRTTRTAFEVYENVGLFVAGLYAMLQAAISSDLAEDRRTAGRFGLRLISEILRTDEGMTYLPYMRAILFSVPFAWLVQSRGFFVDELLTVGNGDLRELRYWRDRLAGFFAIWQCSDHRYRNLVAQEIERFNVALSTESE